MIFVLTYVLTLFLIVLPVPSDWVWLLPRWELLFVTWWALMRNHQLSIAALMLASLPIDVAYGTALGLHALIFAILAYVLTLLGPKVRQVNVIRQSMVILLVLSVVLAVGYWGRTLTGQVPSLAVMSLQALTTALAWPVLKRWYEGLARFGGDPELRTT